MPHFIAECSENIRTEADLPGLFQQVNRLLAESGLFPLAGIRSRAHWVDTWQMADGAHDYAFVHMTLKIGHGRTQQQLMPVMEQLFACIREHFADLMARRYLALSLVVEELHPQLNFKQNNVHALFRKE
jgi:5-carboxymethyl-2-hydroxymuconate isomerase